MSEAITTPPRGTWDDQHDDLILEAIHRWTFWGLERRVNGCILSRWQLNSIPDYVLGAELRGLGVPAASRTHSLIERGFVEDAPRRSSIDGEWELADKRMLSVQTTQLDDGFKTDVAVDGVPCGSYQRSDRPYGRWLRLTCKGVEAAEASLRRKAEKSLPEVALTASECAYPLNQRPTDVNPDHQGARDELARKDTEVSPLEVWESLSDRQRNCLQVLFELKAFDVESRKNRTEIAQKADGPGANGNSYGEPLTRLVKLRLLKRKSNRGGGFWLSSSGLDLVKAAGNL